VIEIRRIEPDEWKLLREVRLAALADAPSAFGSTYAREAGFAEDVWRDRIANAGFFLAFDGAEPVGLAAGRRDFAAPPTQRELVSMWVSRTARGRRIAGMLVEAVAAWARADGAGELSLWVVIDNGAARRAYERLGFVANGIRQPVVPDEPDRVEEQMLLTLPADRPTP
jgi:GNAT superfamily N-acetyltransferase